MPRPNEMRVGMRNTSTREVTVTSPRSRRGLLLSARTVGAPGLPRPAVTVLAFDVIVDARKEERGEREPPQLEEQKAEASDEAAPHARTLAIRVPTAVRAPCGGARRSHAPAALTARRAQV